MSVSHGSEGEGGGGGVLEVVSQGSVTALCGILTTDAEYGCGTAGRAAGNGQSLLI